MADFKEMSVEELVAYRDEQRNIKYKAIENFRAAGKVLEVKRLMPRMLAKKAKLEADAKELEAFDVKVKEVDNG
jgi:hypothetical protein